MLLLFKDLSPSTFTSIFEVVDNNPIRSLARVPELPKFNFKFFFANKEPTPLPKIKFYLGFNFFILTPNF